jgi:acid phosphatase family membrane protein YuiD
MHKTRYQARILLATLTLLLSCRAFSQGSTKKMTDSSGLHSYVVMRGDTVVIQNDSSYLLNKIVFKLFHENYRRSQQGSPEMKKLFQNYEDIIGLQDSMLLTKERYYHTLKTSFDSLLIVSNQFVKRTDANVNSINQSLDSTTRNLNNINAKLDTSLKELKSVNGEKFKWAIRGFTVGIVIAAAVFLVAK